MTSLGTCITSNDMIADKQTEENHQEILSEKPISTRHLPQLGAAFKSMGRDVIDLMVLRQRISDTNDRKILMQRRTDWLKDLNMNLFMAKVIKSTHYLED